MKYTKIRDKEMIQYKKEMEKYNKKYEKELKAIKKRDMEIKSKKLRKLVLKERPELAPVDLDPPKKPRNVYQLFT